jgi:phosphohistidine swiveling domain-containing protein/DNA-binding Xre family transcriptional regulator
VHNLTERQEFAMLNKENAHYTMQNNKYKISLKFNNLAKKLDKNINDIAQEAKINRNTVSALFHGKMSGVKFSTLEKICSTYNVKVSDIFELSSPETVTDYPVRIYKQEGEAVPFMIVSPLSAYGREIRFGENQTYNLGDLSIYIKNEYFYAFWDFSACQKTASQLFEYFSKEPNKFEVFYLDFQKYAGIIEKMYYESTSENVVGLSNVELKHFFSALKDAYKNFWEHSLFIDVFDIGIDQSKIKEIKKWYGLSNEEVGILTTPSDLLFSNERKLKLLEITATLLKNKRSTHPEAQLKKFLDENRVIIEKYKKDFDFYKSGYTIARHITDEEIISEIEVYLKNEKFFETELNKLKNSSVAQNDKILTVLKKNDLKQNPFWFFSRLTYWREYRKKINLMGIHVLDMVLDSVENKIGIPKKYLSYLTLNEVENALDGLIDQEVLVKRSKGDILITGNADGIKILKNDEARSIKNELERRSSVDNQSDAQIIYGQVASQGYAKGIARIVNGIGDFSKFKDGEILVAGATRPEFLPIMKKAAAIVTNEGGVTCHAAIISRELGKPCIIGTKNATSLIKDGDLVEVRAHHGTVRIIK